MGILLELATSAHDNFLQLNNLLKRSIWTVILVQESRMVSKVTGISRKFLLQGV